MNPINTNSPLLSLDQIAAKTEPFQSIKTHSVVTGIVAQELFSAFLAPGVREKLTSALGMDLPTTQNFIGYFAGLHDIGKLGQRFASCLAKNLTPDQRQPLIDRGLLLAEPQPGVRHEITGMRILESIWDDEDDPAREDTITLLAGVLGAHHQGSSSTTHDYSKRSPWKPYWTALEQEMAGSFLRTSFRVPVVSHQDFAFVGAILNGLVIMADWIASGAAFSEAQDVLQKLNGLAELKERAAAFVADSQLASASFCTEDTFDSVWPQYAGHARPMQQLTEQLFRDTKPWISLLLIEAPMGEGKTESAVYAACQMMKQWEKSGLYFALPTAATANQMIERVRGFLDQHEAAAVVRLLHGMAWLQDSTEQPADFNVDEDAVRIASEWLKPKRRAMLGGWAVGTVDQAMMAAMFVRYGVLRLLGLSNKVLVIDEVHAYDVYMSEIIKTLLQWAKALDIPVVLLSATLPSDKRAELIGAYGGKACEAAYPGITCVDETGATTVYRIEGTVPRDPVRVRLHPLLHKVDETARLAISLAEEGGAIGVMVNTVDEAQALYSQIVALRGSDEGVLLFHSRFLAERRKEIEEQCMRDLGSKSDGRNRNKILVCTQVVEQSLDIDLDALITAAAPMDLLLQRTGRMHRCRERDEERPAGLRQPVLHVLVPADDDWGVDGIIYPPCLLQQTHRLLTDRTEITFPRDIPLLVEAGYDPSQVPPEEMEDWFQNAVAQDLERTQSRTVVLGTPDDGFAPLKQRPDLDDLEDHGYLSAKTRLSQPAVRLALLEPELYRELEKQSTEEGVAKVYSRTLGERVMQKSVSIPESKLKRFSAPLRGAGLLQNVLICPIENGTFIGADGTAITVDDKLGVTTHANDNGN